MEGEASRVEHLSFTPYNAVNPSVQDLELMALADRVHYLTLLVWHLPISAPTVFIVLLGSFAFCQDVCALRGEEGGEGTSAKRQ
jgi:hypothetical protein